MTSTIKVNNIQNQCGANIINENSNTITIGASGDTIALASGASQTGFGRTGTVNWQTTTKTGDFTAVNGEGYFVDTTSGAVVMTMPSGSAGAIVAIQDYNKTFDNNSLTVTPASGQKINGGSADGVLIISTEGQGLTFVYVDSTVGWKTVYENEFTTGGTVEILATGGSITTSGNDKIHTFTGPGTFCVSQISSTPANNEVSYLVVAGGGGAGGIRGGGSGAGGFRESKSPVTPYTASPLDGRPNAPNRITITATAFPITVGGGGVGQSPSTTRVNGSNSIFSTITSAGGAKGGQYGNGGDGGSGGGGSNDTYTGGAGNTPPTTPAQGTNGGNSTTGAGYAGAGGGGGATQAGQNGGPAAAGPGGTGATTSINATPTVYAGGGGGGVDAGGTASGGGPGGGGDGAAGSATGNSGTANTGGGAGGTGYQGNTGGSGGSGIVIIRYKFQ